MTEERIELWVEILKPVPSELAQKALKEIVRSPREFAPSVGMLYDACKIEMNAEADRLATSERLKLIGSTPAVTPERIEEIKREVATGKYDGLYLSGKGYTGD